MSHLTREIEKSVKTEINCNTCFHGEAGWDKPLIVNILVDIDEGISVVNYIPWLSPINLVKVDVQSGLS